MRLAVIFALALSGCVAQAPLNRTTPSGYPEETFLDAQVDEIRSAVMNVCVNAGVLVQESGPNHVLCGKTLSGNDAVLAQLVVGNSYSTTPERKVRFTIVQQGTAVRVVAQEWIETQMAFGQMRRSELTSNNQRNDLQAVLARVGNLRSPPRSTTAPGAVSTPQSSAPGHGGCRWVTPLQYSCQ